MVSAIHIPFLLCALACTGDAAAPPSDAQAAVVELALKDISGDDASSVVLVRGEADDKNGTLEVVPKVMFFGGDNEDLRVVNELPNVWIGVRVTPVPKPLASHLKREGLMIENVANDSPADRAGLEQYDVIVSLAGKNVDNMNDLLDAVRDAGAGNQVEMVVIRGGAVADVTVTPTERSEMGELSFKYEEAEEPEDTVLNKYFGHRMKVGPDGAAVLMPHGQMVLPDDVEDILRNIPDFEWSGDFDIEDIEDLIDTQNLPFGMKIEIDSDDAGGMHWITKHGDQHEISGEMEIAITENGETTSIRRTDDGEITVVRVDADGNETTDAYDDEDALRDADEDAYKLYQKFSVGRGHAMFMVKPDLNGLGLHQKRFEIELKNALDKVRDATDAADKACRRIEIHRGAADGDAHVDVKSKTVMIRIEDDGRIILDITEDGVSKKYEFKSREDFEREEPELFEKYGKDLEMEGACGDAQYFAAMS